MSARLLFSVAMLAASAVPSGSEASQGGEAMPRYRFEVGQELVYRLTRQQDFEGAADSEGDVDEKARDRKEWRLYVVSKNADGSYRLFIASKVALMHDDGSVRAEWQSLGQCDLHPDGSWRVDEKTAIAKRILPHACFAVCRTRRRNWPAPGAIRSQR